MTTLGLTESPSPTLTVSVEGEKLRYMLDPTPAETKGAQTPATSGRVAHVLVVDDSPGNRMLVQRMLASFGHSSAAACSGREALALIREECFDLVLMDCEMPEMDGYTATRVLRQREAEEGLERLPVIAATAHVLELERELSREAGMDGFLEKPIEMEALEQVLRSFT